MEKVRLQKILAQAGVGSRRQCEEYIKDGLVKVNNFVAQIGTKVKPTDEIFFQEKQIFFSKHKTRLLLFNKPRGIICSSKPERNKKSIFSFLPNDSQENWKLVGRLDINTSGLIFFTNDGDLVNFLAHPKSSFDREYLVRARGTFDENIRKNMLTGIKIENKIYQFSDIVLHEGSGSNKFFTVCLFSGKNKEVRKLFESMGLQVSRLKRLRYGPIFLPDNLAEGKFVELTDKDIIKIREYGK